MQIGDKFGNLTLIDNTKTGKNRRKMLFQCDCGTIKYINYVNVKNGAIKSCGCLVHKGRFTDLSNRRFGRLIVLAEDHQEYKKFPGSKYSVLRHYWKCQCDCGNKTIVEQGQLLSGHTKSCGCFQKEQTSKVHRIHGETGSRLYNKWRRLISRCYDTTNKRYQQYGGRGITVCDEWLGATGYINFRDWCYLNGYSDKRVKYSDMLSIDRKDNDGPYAPWNCRFTNWVTQQNNRSNNKYIFDGEETLTQNQCDAKYGYPAGFTSRKRHANWPDHAIIYIMRKGYKNVYKVKNTLKFYDEDGFELLIPTKERLQELINQGKI